MDVLSIWLTVLGWILGQALYQYTDFVQLDKRGRSGTRQDLRRWICASFMNYSEEAVRSAFAIKTCSSHTNLSADICPGLINFVQKWPTQDGYLSRSSLTLCLATALYAIYHYCSLYYA